MRGRFGWRWTATYFGTVTQEGPVTFGPFVECVMRGSSFDRTTFRFRAWTKRGAWQMVAPDRLPEGLTVSLTRGWPYREVLGRPG